jgi:hypothetical protein
MGPAVRFTGLLVAIAGIVLCPWRAPGADFPTFVNVAEEAGIVFEQETGATGRHYNPEFSGAGLCVFDYDGDGWVDLYAVNGARLPGFEASGEGPTNRLYRNNGDGSFTDVTAQTGVGDTGYGMAAVAVDYDNDGDTDLYVGNYGPNVLYRNNGDATFSNVTTSARVGDDGWSAGCAFADYDGDGDLDLYVANYLEYRPGDEEGSPTPYVTANLRNLKDVKAYAGPLNFPPQSNRLYRNNGDGTFDDVAKALGVDDPEGRGMGIGWSDYDNDGDVDLYVSDDEGANSLFQNNGPWPGGSFSDVGLISGTAYDADGSSQSTMGIAFGDYDNDGQMDLATTAFQGEVFSIYRNEGFGLFSDVAMATQTGGVTRTFLGWGVCFLDVDADGLLDLFMATGHVQDGIEEIDPSTTTAQQNLLFRNMGNGRFRDVTHLAGPGMTLHRQSRAAVVLDFDNDGDVDIAVLNKRSHGARPLAGGIDLLRNDGGDRSGHWIAFHLIGAGKPGSNRSAVGARLEVWTGHLRQIREVAAGSGYQSQDDLRQHVGLGEWASADSVVVRWPSGSRMVLRHVEGDRYLTLREELPAGGED